MVILFLLVKQMNTNYWEYEIDGGHYIIIDNFPAMIDF